jgi:ABC-type polysaccharide/polyol phosphate transport system ATPase subunit
MAHIQLETVNFNYPVFNLTGRSVKMTFASRVARQGDGAMVVRALRGVSLKVTDGERIGLIGANGSGKSTLLRVIAGLAKPQSGLVDIVGRTIPLIDRGVGINHELPGLSNIELPLRLLGATNEEIEHAKSWVPEFTGLGDFIKLPVRTYSDGMKARLAFALCTAITGDILVLDEWLSAGDLGFVERAEHQLKDLVHKTKILVIASHSLELLRTLCTTLVWMEGGRIRMKGAPDEVLAAYVEAMHATA